VLSLDSVLSFVGLSAANPFALSASRESGFFALLGGYAAMTLLFAVVAFAFGFLFGASGSDLRHRFGSVGAFLVFGLVAVILWRLSTLLGLYDWLLDTPLKLEGAVYASVGAVFFYYVLVAASEEAVKHFGLLAGYSAGSDSLVRAVIAGMFVALGFSFVENILYLANIASSGSLLSGLYWQTLGYRSVFSTLLHVTCSAVLAAAFFRSFADSRQITPTLFAKYLAYGVGVSVVAHAVFNSSMVLGFPGIVFAYLVGGYLYITSTLASHEPEEGYAPSSSAGYL
jgi:RsiW-degrading membrane proteinase PrsW (M82 family)